MLTIGDGTMAALSRPHYKNNVAALTEAIAHRIRSGALPVDPEIDSLDALRSRLEALLEQAQKLQIDEIGDVLAFSCLMLHGRPPIDQTEIWPAVSEFVSATNIPSEQRFDAIYAILPPAIAAAVFETPA